MLNIKETCEYIAKKLGRKSFSEATVRSWIFLGKLKADKVGGKPFIKIEDIENFLPESLRDNKKLFEKPEAHS